MRRAHALRRVAIAGIVSVAATFTIGVIGIATASTAAPPTNPSCIYTPSDFTTAFLNEAGFPNTAQNREVMTSWEASEGGNGWGRDSHGNLDMAKYNPLNTTYPYDGSTTWGASIAVYRNWADGVYATVQTLRGNHTGYATIRADLQAGNNALATARAIDSSVWGTKAAESNLGKGFNPAPPPWAVPCTSTNHQPIGAFDGLTSNAPGSVQARGWALDPDTNNPINIDVYVDGAFKTRQLANGYRPDVDNAYHHGAYHGYDATVAGLYGGNHQVCVYAIDSAGGRNPVIACKNITLPGGNPIGKFDNYSVSNGTVVLNGWAIDPDTTKPVNVDVWYDNTTVYGGRYLANTSRPDVGNVYPAYGSNHGYSIHLTLPHGSHTVCTFGINVGTGTTNPVLGCETIIV